MFSAIAEGSNARSPGGMNEHLKRRIDREAIYV